MFNFISERLNVGKVPVDRSKSYISDFIELLQSLHYNLADSVSRDLMITLIIKTVLDLIYDLLEIGIRHGSLRAGGCNLHTAHFAIECHGYGSNDQGLDRQFVVST